MFKLIHNTMVRSFRLIPKHSQRRSWRVLGHLFIQSALDVLGLGLILAMVPVLFDRNKLFALRDYPIIGGMLGGMAYEAMLISCLVFILIVYALKNLIYVFLVRYQAEFAFDIYRFLATRLHRIYFNRGYLYLKKRNSTEVVRDVAAVTGRFSENILLPLFMLLNESLILLAIIFVVLWLDPKAFFFVAGVVFLPSLIFFHFVKHYVSQLQERVNTLSARLQKNLFESIFGFADVRTTRTEEFFFKRYADSIRSYCECLRTSAVYNLLPSRMLEVFFVLGAASLCAYVSFQIRAPGQAVAFLTTYVVAAYRVLPSINRITLSLLSIKGYQYTLDTVEEALFSETEQKAHVSESLNFERSISIESLSYKYPGREEETLNQVSFSIQKGECIGLVGPSGSGKTTLLNILLGFISPSSGGIRVDDTYLTPDRLDAWYRLIGYVQQEVFLLEGTLRENIAFGILKEDVDPSRLEVAIRRASLAQLVASIPGGMDAMIGERGANLSVGQKQRIGIARALYSGAQILIFDEATSALDAQTELEITESISSLSKEGFTIVIVAHRKSTLKHTHRIFELQKGNLQRETTYQELSTEV